jgi:hypothetical protein
LGTPYSAGDPDTFVNLNGFELRTSASAGDDDGIQLCKLPSSPSSVTAIVYMAGTRLAPSFPTPSNSCLTFDINGDGSTSGTGDFQLIPPTGVHVWGDAFSGDGASVIVLER